MSDLTPEDIDIIIESYYQTKKEIKSLQSKQDEYKAIINKVLNNNNVDIIKGNNLQVKRIIQSRKYLDKGSIPDDIFDKYSVKRKISMLIIKNNNSVSKSRSRSRSR